jgi:hypothetical protein
MIDRAKQSAKANVGLLVSDPREYMASLNDQARAFNQASDLATQAKLNEMRGLLVTPEQASAKEYVDRVNQDLAMGFAGTVNPTQGKLFKNWFKESKVVDENNLPLTVYTGSKADIKQFSPELSMPFGQISPTFWFSNKPNIASGYAMDATRKGESIGAVYPAKLSLQNPLVIDAKNNNWNNITINNDTLKLRGLEAGKQKASTDYIAYIARQNGYDGLIIKNAKDNPVGVSGEISDVYAAFAPEQIKSIFNKGSFNPKDPRILYGGGLVGTAQVEIPKKKENKK